MDWVSSAIGGYPTPVFSSFTLPLPKGRGKKLESSLSDGGRIGVDESGKGDYFGPLVIAACFVADWHLAELDGVKDSKKLTDKMAMSLAAQIKKTCPYAIVAIGPAKYNELYAKMKNLNKLLSWGHAQAIQNVAEKHPADKAISDQFGDPSYIRYLLGQKGVVLELESKVRAEEDMAVAAASVLARAEFLWRLKRLGEEAGIDLPKGASQAVIAAGKRYVEKHGASSLGNVAKLHFRTSESVLNSTL